MKRSKAHVLRVLRNTGLFEVAKALESELPDVVDFDRDFGLFERHGLELDVLMSRMGGSP